MSAYITDDLCINRMLASMAGGEPMARIEDRKDMGERLRAMNIQAVKVRYPDSADNMLPNGYQYRSMSPPRPAQALKSLACFLYQCSEGDVPESALYQQVGRFRDELAYHIATSTPEYDAAEWG